ncbi:N-acetylmuramoyl-L-alanine amidase [Thermococcus waiotapuensis]|uniref:N-acetylmuramoyl-L-alanine amidase n=1 Tax=Thermococcus waiotapuensis TaxID=90909 RepID=A0AAE4NV15_9EURY|nr:N-acetylmuramoyl-L-alanine amidase [Thermococcus waiotapuensis]MDV3103353.1 N-acetylmuramoyl-L-alanine amidase [Thermococcus waiotapuensis]
MVLMKPKALFVAVLLFSALLWLPATGAGPSSLSGYTICVDAGHGGSDPGAVGYVVEKTVNLEIALKVAKLLEMDGAKVVLARNGDYDVSLPQRVQIANSAGCNIFISIHANAGPSSASGFEVYHYYGSSRGNSLATYVDSEIAKLIPLWNRGVKEAGFYVIKYTNMPAILIETGFVTNSYDAGIIGDESYQWKYAYAILHGVQRYFGVPVHDPVSIPTVKNVRFADSGSYFRVVLDMSEKANYHVYYTSYSKGYRLVIQVDNAQLANLGWPVSNGQYYIRTGSTIAPVIYATQSGNNVLVIVELSSPYRPYKSFTLSNPDRIVVDIYP